jgi:hypothetical protein
VPLPPDDGRSRRVYVANHPPLFYAISALPIGLGQGFGAPRAAVAAARLLSAALAAGGLVMVAWLALVLAPDRPRVAVGAAWLAALLPSLPHVSAFVYNDGLGFLAAAAGFLVAGLAAGPAIGFYLRNRSLYGSLTAAAYNQELFRFKPQDHVLDLLLSPAYALRLYDGLWAWTRFNLPRVPALPLLVAVPRVIGVLALGGLALAAAGRLLGPRRAGPDAAGVASWALALAWLAGVFAMVAAYDGNGGHLHPRYLFPGLAVLAVVVALGLDRLPGARRGLWVAGVALAQLVLTAAAWGGFLTALDGRRPDGPGALLGGIARLLGARGVPWPAVLLGLAGALLVVALGLLAGAVALLAPRPSASLRRRGRVRPAGAAVPPTVGSR